MQLIDLQLKPQFSSQHYDNRDILSFPAFVVVLIIGKIFKFLIILERMTSVFME